MKYSFAGVSKRAYHSPSKLPVSLFRYGTRPGTWSRVPGVERAPRRKTSSPDARRTRGSPKRQRSNEMKAEGVSVKEGASESDEDGEPIARRACQVVYDPTARTFYLHGGTAQTKDPQTGVINDERLDDFWSMTLERCVTAELLPWQTLVFVPNFGLLDLHRMRSSGVRHSRCEDSSEFLHHGSLVSGRDSYNNVCV